jgi:hypothetical protein
MADTAHLKILKRGVKEWNQWRVAHPDIKPYFVGANLTEAELTEADLSVSLCRQQRRSQAFL